MEILIGNFRWTANYFRLKTFVNGLRKKTVFYEADGSAGKILHSFSSPGRLYPAGFYSVF